MAHRRKDAETGVEFTGNLFLIQFIARAYVQFLLLRRRKRAIFVCRVINHSARVGQLMPERLARPPEVVDQGILLNILAVLAGETILTARRIPSEAASTTRFHSIALDIEMNPVDVEDWEGHVVPLLFACGNSSTSMWVCFFASFSPSGEETTGLGG